jgi:hypothetical protein
VASLAAALPSRAAAQVVIHELRIDQPGPDTDEYVELAGPPGTLLDGLAYIVIGDGPSSGRGVVEAIVRLDGVVIPPSGLLVIAEATFSLGVADLRANLNFENGDAVTHALVRGLAASLGDDLDVDDDGILDLLPFAEILDAIALVGSPQMTATGSAYFIDERAGPDDGGVPFHVIRCPDAEGAVRIGAADPAAGSDTPGGANACPGPPPEPLAVSIPALQGAGHRSPFEGVRVSTTGVVTAVHTSGLYLQDPAGDGDAHTSDAVFVFTAERPDVLPGDALVVIGTVVERVAGGASSRNLSLTQLEEATFVGLARGEPLPEPVRIGRGGRRPPTRIIDDDAFAVFDPEHDGIDFFESLEGMRVMLPDARAVGPTTRFGETFVAVDGLRGATGVSRRGTLTVTAGDFNPERIQVQTDAGVLPMPRLMVGVGARLGDVIGVVGYAFGSYEVIVSEPLAKPVQGVREPERTRLLPLRGHLSVASFNVKNLDPNDGDGDRDVALGRFDALGRIIAYHLRAPDIVALQEIQDDTGAANTGDVSAGLTLARLCDAIEAAGGPRYTAIDHPFLADGTSGGQPGGNIRVAYLYDASRVTLIEGSLSAIVDPAAQQSDRSHPYFRSRPPLRATFRFGHDEVTLINLHLSSKTGSAPLFGSLQPSVRMQEHPMVNGGVDARRAQAAVIADHVAWVLAHDPGAHIVVLGDMNELTFVSPLRSVLGGVLSNLVETLLQSERYTFIFEGNAQALDHVFVSPSLRGGARFDIVHVNAELPDIPARASDHDPVLARLSPRGRRGAALVRLIERLVATRAASDRPDR